MILTLDLKPGMTIELDGRVMQVTSLERHKTVGRGGGMVRTRLKDIETGNVYEKTFRSTEKVAQARVERRDHQYLYNDGVNYYFMDTETYEQVQLSPEQVGEQAKWLKEGETVNLTTYEGKLVGIEVPNAVERRVVRTDPGVRGDTAQGGTKPALIEGGVTVDVPLFIDQDDMIRVDTSTVEYVSRV